MSRAASLASPADHVRPVPDDLARSVKLDRKADSRAIEIQDIGTDRVLQAKSQRTEAAAAQQLPKHDLGQAHRPPQGPGTRM